jgi:hypothetical protein
MFKWSRAAARGAAVIAIVASASACGSSSPTVQGATATVQPTDQPTDTATPIAEATPTPTVEPTPTQEATPTPEPTATPTATPTPTPEASPTSVAWQCTGTADHQAFFAETATKLSFDVYCGNLPNGWYLQDAAYVLASGGKLTIDYKGPGGATLVISEGAFCTTSAADCSPHDSIRGTASFGDKPGMLDVLTTPPDVFVVYVDPGTSHAYQISGANLTQAKFVALAAAMVVVPKS